MLQRTLIVWGMLLSMSVFANFPQEFQDAMALYRSGKPADAEQAFLRLLDQNPRPRGADKCLAAAAACAMRQKQFDKAMAYAEKIQDTHEAKACRMHILESQSKWDDVLLIAGDEDLEAWPDELIYDAAITRARAHARKQNVEKSAEDFRRAIAHTVLADNQAFALRLLGEMYSSVAKDNAKALEAYAEVMSMTGSVAARSSGAAIAARAKILNAQGQGAQVLAELDRLKVEEIRDPHWRCALLIVYGETYESMGRKAEALARYKEAASSPKAPEVLLKTVKARIESLETRQEAR